MHTPTLSIKDKIARLVHEHQSLKHDNLRLSKLLAEHTASQQRLRERLEALLSKLHPLAGEHS